MPQEIPSLVAVGLNLGGLAALLFLVANLAVIFHLVQRLIAPKSRWAWLDGLRRRWHYVHYIGNLAMVGAMIAHAALLGPYASPLHWLLVALLVWMAGVGITLRFTNASPKVKRGLSRLHSRWYMFVAVLVVLIAAHIWSLANSPYPLE